MLQRLFASRRHPYVSGLDKPENIEFDLSGSKLSLTLPSHSDYEGFEARQAPITQLNIYDPNNFQDPGPLFSYAMLVKRTWEFYGPMWLTRPIGTTNFTGLVGKAVCLPEGMSCFNPNHFEQLINRILYKSGPESPSQGEKLAPVNWLVTHQEDNLWVTFELRNNLSKIYKPSPAAGAQYSSYTVTALDDRHYLLLSFRNLGYAPNESAIKHMNALRDSVLRSARLNLSPTAQNRLQAARQLWPNASISPKRQPENWFYPEWRYGDSAKNEPRIVILNHGTPPPEFTP